MLCVSQITIHYMSRGLTTQSPCSWSWDFFSNNILHFLRSFSWRAMLFIILLWSALSRRRTDSSLVCRISSSSKFCSVERRSHTYRNLKQLRSWPVQDPINVNLEPRNLLVHARFCLQNVYELVKALNCNIEILI